MDNGKLSDLIISESEVNERLIYNILSPHINILKNEKRLVPKNGFLELNIDKKILIWLLGRNAMIKLKIIDQERAGPKEIAEGTITKLGSVKPTLRALEKRGLIESIKGKYKISSLGIFELKGKNRS